MPTAPIDEQNNVLFYEDSGVPDDCANDYTTLVVVHGTAFHGAVFRRILPFAAAKYRVRVILVNRRDYPGSSPYNDEDIQNISNPTDGNGYESFYRARGLEFAAFTEWLVTHENIPKADWETKTGGVFILMWSAGNAFALPMLSYADSVRASTRDAIKPYLRGFIIFDAPRWFLGLPFIAYGDNACIDQNIPMAQRIRSQSSWVGRYYSHPSLVSNSVADLQVAAGPNARTGSAETMSQTELAECTDYTAVLRSELKSKIGPVQGFDARVRRAVFDERLARECWPRCRVDVIWCEMSPWPMVETGWTFERYKREYAEKGVAGRELTVSMMPNVNHFAHWDDPEITMAFFAKTMGH